MTSAGDSATVFEPGAAVGHYVIESRLGDGTQSVVLLARDSLLGRKVALKVLHSGQSGDTRSVEEARLAARLEHPHVLRTYHAFRHRGVWLVAYEYAHGGTIAARVASHGAYTTSEALVLCQQLAAGLAYVHDEGVLHRDVKPQNMLLTRQGDAKLADFGLALDVRSPNLASLANAGTPAFLAPELWGDGKHSAAADVYALGHSLYFMLVGRMAFALGDAKELRQAHLSQLPLIPEQLPRGLAELLAAMLDKQPAARPSARDVSSELTQLMRNPHRARTPLSLGAPQLSEPCGPESLQRALHVALDAAPERHFVREIGALLERERHAIVLLSDPEADTEPFLSSALRSCPVPYTQLAKLAFEQDGSRLVELTRAGSTGRAHDGLDRALTALAPSQAPVARPLLNVQLPAKLVAEQERQLSEILRCALTRNVTLVLTGPTVLGAHFTDAAAPHAVADVIHLPSTSSLRARLQRWISTASAERYTFTSDALRVFCHLHAREAHPWTRLARSSLLVAAAAGLPLVTSWAVLTAAGIPRELRELMDVPASARVRPLRWPSEEGMRLLTELREAEAECRPSSVVPLAPASLAATSETRLVSL